MTTPRTGEEWKRLIDGQRRRYAVEIAGNFPEEAVADLRADLASLGEQGWSDWMCLHHDRIVDFLRNLPRECRRPLDYRNNARLYCAVLSQYYRALNLLELLEQVDLVQLPDPDGDEFFHAVADAAESLDLLAYAEPHPRWPFQSTSPFVW